MSFFAPLFLLGALAVVGPIVFHLIRRTTREVTPFSSLLFLQPTPPRVTRRSRLENLWLLALRCLVVALLALSFARPFVATQSSAPVSDGGAGKRVVLLLDTSASMRRENLWPEAVRQVEQAIRAASSTDQLALLTFGPKVETLLSFEEWTSVPANERVAFASARFATLAPGWGATGIDAALIRAAELLEGAPDSPTVAGEVVLISDLQEGASVDGLQGYEWPRNVQVVLAPVQAQEPGNASAHWIAEDEAAPALEDGSVRVRVSAGAESKRDQYELRWDAPGAAPLTVYVPAGQSRTARVLKAPEGASTLLLSGDDAEFDNRLHVLPAAPMRLPVLFVGEDAEEDPRASLFYVRRAFSQTGRESVELIAHRGPEAVPAQQLEAAQLLIIGDGVAAAPLASAREFARHGRIVLAALTSAASTQFLGDLLEAPQLSATEAVVKNYGLLGQLDFQHPLFAPFAEPRFSDFTKINFWKWRVLDLAPLRDVRVLARFDTGDPAIFQVPLGKGSVVVFTSSWRPADSQLALSSKFVPLLHGLLEQSRNVPVQKAQYVVGDTVELPPETRSVRMPDGAEISLVDAPFAGTDEPGVYLATPGGRRFVVNLAPGESRVAPLTSERFSALGVPLARNAEGRAAQLAQAEVQKFAAVEQRQKLWRWLLLVALGVLLLETVIAGRLSRLTPSTAVPT